MKAAIFRNVPRYGWNIAKVGVKHQLINQSIEMYTLSCIIIYFILRLVIYIYIFEWILFQNIYRSQLECFAGENWKNIVKPELCKKYYDIFHIE